MHRGSWRRIPAVALLTLAGPASISFAAVLVDVPVVTGVDSIDPAGAETLDLAAVGSTPNGKSDLENRADLRVVQSFTGATGGAAGNILSFTNSSLPDIRITLASPLSIPSTVGADFTANSNRNTSGQSSILFTASGSGTISMTIEFGNYDTASTTFTPNVNSVDAFGFTAGNAIANSTWSVDFKNAAGFVLATQTLAGAADTNDTHTGNETGGDGYFGFNSPGNHDISSVVITRFMTTNTGSTIDDIAFTTVPEPGTIGLLGVAAAGLLTRRRRC